MSAFVSISPVSCSEDAEDSSEAVIDWLSAVTVPGRDRGSAAHAARVAERHHAVPGADRGGVPGRGGGQPGRAGKLEHRDVVRLVIADHGRRVGLAVANVGDADRGRAVDHVVIGEDLAVRGQHDAGAKGGRLLIAKRGLHVHEARVHPAGDLRRGQRCLRGRRRRPARGRPVRQPDGRTGPRPGRDDRRRGQPEHRPATVPLRRLRCRVLSILPVRILCEWLAHWSCHPESFSRPCFQLHKKHRLQTWVDTEEMISRTYLLPEGFLRNLSLPERASAREGRPCRG